MTVPSSLAFLDHLLREEPLEAPALSAFLATSTSDEGLHLDFKTGLMFDLMPANEKKRRAQENDRDRRERCRFVVRQYVTAFANSEGGVLAIGVKDQTREEKLAKAPKVLEPITGAHEEVTGDLKEWASRCVSDLIGGLGVPPRFLAVNVNGGKVLLVAVLRAPSLVPLIKEGEQVYYFRVEDEARKVYPHMVADLLLGRRRHPRLGVSDHRCSLQLTGPALRLSIEVEIENDSLVRARDVRLGLVAFRPVQEEHDSLVPALRQRVDAAAAPEGHALTVSWLRLGADGTTDLPALRSAVFEGTTVDLPLNARTASLALIILPDDAEPSLVQVDAAIQRTAWDAQCDTPGSVTVSFAPAAMRRPRVALELADESQP